MQGAAFHPFLGRILYVSYDELIVLIIGCLLSIWMFENLRLALWSLGFFSQLKNIKLIIICIYCKHCQSSKSHSLYDYCFWRQHSSYNWFHLANFVQQRRLFKRSREVFIFCCNIYTHMYHYSLWSRARIQNTTQNLFLSNQNVNSNDTRASRNDKGRQRKPKI